MIWPLSSDYGYEIYTYVIVLLHIVYYIYNIISLIGTVNYVN